MIRPNGWHTKPASQRIPESTRQLVLERDGWACKLRLARCTVRATQVDHVVERWRGGDDDPANLRASCARCNADANHRSRPRPERESRPQRRHPGLL